MQLHHVCTRNTRNSGTSEYSAVAADCYSRHWSWPPSVRPLGLRCAFQLPRGAIPLSGDHHASCDVARDFKFNANPEMRTAMSSKCYFSYHCSTMTTIHSERYTQCVYFAGSPFHCSLFLKINRRQRTICCLMHVHKGRVRRSMVDQVYIRMHAHVHYSTGMI